MVRVFLSVCVWLIAGAAPTFALADWPVPTVPAVLKSEVDGINYMREEKAPEAIAALEQAVEDGSATALYRLAQIYYEGMGEQWSITDKSIEYLKKAVAKNQVEAMFMYALVGPKTEHSVLTYMDRAAMLGMAANVFKVGLTSVTEKTPFHPPMGIQLIESAARAGFDPAMAVLGRFYLKGDSLYSIKPDIEKSKLWLNRAIRAGYVSAISDLLKIIMVDDEVYPEEKYKWLYLCRAYTCAYLDENPDVKQAILPTLVDLEQKMHPDMLAQTRVEIRSLSKRIKRANIQE